MLALLEMSLLVVLSWLVGAIAHADDHVSGTWMALAASANSGTLYPPLYDGHFFGGTRFMPVPILLQAGAARVSGEYLVSAKSLSYLLAAALLVLTFVLLRRRCPTPVALMLSSTILVTGTGLTAASSNFVTLSSFGSGIRRYHHRSTQRLQPQCRLHIQPICGPTIRSGSYSSCSGKTGGQISREP